MSDSSSSEDDGFFYEPTAMPYRFEPCYTREQLAARRREQEAAGASRESQSSPTVDRTRDTFWCTCEKCLCMPTEVECVCCHEVPQVQVIIDKFDPKPTVSDLPDPEYKQKCITEHPDFQAHLNEAVLDTYFRSHKYNWRRFPEPKGPNGALTNAQYRLVGYRFILDWLLKGEILGKKKRIPLPACVVSTIRTKYPAEDDEYVGFKYAELPTI